MKISRERTILIAVLGVAGLGLLVDRVLLGSDVTGPAETTAGVMDVQAVDPASLLIQPSREQSLAEQPGGAPLAERLRLAVHGRIGDNELPTRNAFVPSPAWIPSGLGTVQTDEQADRVREFTQQYHLEAVLLTGNRRCAVINGTTVYPGQMLDGYRLLSVRERSAEFEVDGVRVNLRLPHGGIQ